MLYIMRHGKTDWNAEYRLQGRTDTHLNRDGIAMAQAAGRKYQDIHFDVCYCSPLERARKTAELFLAGRDVPIIPDRRLIEMSFGIYEGTANCYEIPDCPMNLLFRSPEKYQAVEGGESLDALYARTGDFLKNTAAPLLAEGKDILIVGHGVMNLSIICQVKGLPRSEFWSTGIENCRLLRLIPPEEEPAGQ